MDHLLRKKFVRDDDCESDYPVQPVRDRTRHVEARVLRRIHKPRERIFWANQDGGVSAARSIETI